MTRLCFHMRIVSLIDLLWHIALATINFFNSSILTAILKLGLVIQVRHEFTFEKLG